jgi:hypothetical protein
MASWRFISPSSKCPLTQVTGTHQTPPEPGFGGVFHSMPPPRRAARLPPPNRVLAAAAPRAQEGVHSCEKRVGCGACRTSRALLERGRCKNGGAAAPRFPASPCSERALLSGSPSRSSRPRAAWRASRRARPRSSSRAALSPAQPSTATLQAAVGRRATAAGYATPKQAAASLRRGNDSDACCVETPKAPMRRTRRSPRT